MYFIADYKDLEGKTIGFLHMSRFANPIVVGTTDGGILMAELELDEDDNFNNDVVINIASDKRAEHLLFNRREDDWLLKDLAKTGVMKLGELKEVQRKRQEAYERIQEEARKKQGGKEYQDYLRLKEKYESK